MGFCHVGETGRKLPTSGDPPALASQSAGITGVSHRTQPLVLLFLIFYFLLYLFIYLFIFETESRSVPAGVHWPKHGSLKP